MPRNGKGNNVELKEESQVNTELKRLILVRIRCFCDDGEVLLSWCCLDKLFR